MEALSDKQARRQLAEARRLFDIACMAYAKTEGSVDTAPLLQKALYAAATVLLRARGVSFAGYEEAVRETQRANEAAKLLPVDVAPPLLELAALAGSGHDLEDQAEQAARTERYRAIFDWSPDLMQAVARAVRGALGGHAPVFERASWPVPLRVFLTTRLGLMLLVYLGLRLSPVSKPPWTAFPRNAFLDGWVRWDAAWYYSVVVRGYDSVHPGATANVIFFPLYPVLSGLLAIPLQLFTSDQSAYYFAALAISQCSTLFAFAGLHRLVSRVESSDAADRATWLAAVFPFSYIFCAAYPDALFFALSVWAFALAVEDRWRAAAVLASLAAVTEQPGLVLPLSLALLYVRERGRKQRAAPGSPPSGTGIATVLGIAAAAPVTLMLYFVGRYGDPIVFIHQYFAPWHGTWGLGNWTGIAHFFASDPPLSQGFPHLWNLLLVPLAAGAVVGVWRRYGTAYALLPLIPLVIAVGVSLTSFGRMLAVCFAVYLWAASRLRERSAYVITCSVFAVTQVFFAYTFSHWGVTGGP